MHSDTSEPTHWKLTPEQRRSTHVRSYSAANRTVDRYSLDAVDAAFDEVTLRAEYGPGSASIPADRHEAQDLVQSLELQLVHLEAQCRQLRKLLDQSC